ncbi:MAG: NAD(P)-binding domain-containing protein [Vicinamibacteria bacterium]|nr:NAD(P)-binding domain-containing protein [Vicinamibacteria bacterium]
MERLPYCLVGAGPAGLAAARWLKALDVPFEGFERHPDVGGIWNIAFPGSPMYESAHFISSKSLSGFRDFPMPESYPDYPSHRQILRYLEGYAERFELRPLFKFGVSIQAARPDRGRWVVRFADGSERAYAGLISAVGCEWRPFMPAFPGTFAGDIIHSREYKHPRQFEGRRVLIVGAGNSGCDIACDASRAASRAWISLRRGYYFIPKHIFGKPADVFDEDGPHLPYFIERPILQGLLRLLNGDVTRLGLPQPDHSILESHPVMNTQILHALQHGDIEARGDVREFRGREVVFADGRVETVDLVVLATGYVRGVPFLPAGTLADDDVSPLFLNVFHRRERDLFVLGHFTADGGAYPLLDRQAELVARVLDARRRGNEIPRFEAALSGKAPDFSGGVRYQNVRRMSNYLKTRPYRAYVDRLLSSLRTG